MRSSVELILESLKELTKKKVKRNANVWSSKILDLHSVKEYIDHKHVPFLSKCFLVNNLLHDNKVQNILSSLIPKIVDKTGLSVEDYSLISYVYSCIDEDQSSETIISNNYSEEALKSSSDNDLLTFLRTMSLVMSRKTFGNVYTQSNIAHEISASMLNFVWPRIKSINTRYLCESVEYMAFSEILLETIFISDILGKLEPEVLNHNIIDYGSIFSLIRVSHLILNKRDEIVERINLSDYNTVLDVLRKMRYFKLRDHYFTHHIFNRLCNTPAKSRMCRNETVAYLNGTLDQIDASIKLGLGDDQDLKRLQMHLRAIKNSSVLEYPHRSRIRWNYPCFIA